MEQIKSIKFKLHLRSALTPSVVEMLKVKKAGILIFNLQFLFLNIFANLPAIAATDESPLTIVYSAENANQWAGITNRLQAAGVKYCVVSLTDVQNVGDWGERRVLFLPNVETLTPIQAIALEEWMSKGGRLIASGPVGSASAPGVRQLLRTLLGGYWGFSLNQSQEIQPPKIKAQAWARQKELFGRVRGGVVISDKISSEATAVWNSPDSPTAVLTTERSTLLGWRWGIDTAAAADLDSAWLKASFNYHLSTPSYGKKNIADADQNCVQSVPNITKKPTVGETATRPISPLPRVVQPFAPKPPKTATAPLPRLLPRVTPRRSDEAIDTLEQAVRLDVVPNSNAPISAKEAIALQHELENLIGRVESAHRAALIAQSGNGTAITRIPRQLTDDNSQLVSSRKNLPIISREQVIAQAKEVARNLPQLIAQKNYALARQQWLTAKTSLWKQFPVDRRLAQPEIRSVWLDRGTIVRAGGEAGLAEIFDRLAQAGINTVFFETVNASYTIYPSQVAPQQNPLIKGWDPLATGVKLAHERGMELHAWVWTFAAGNQRHNEIINVNPNYPGPVLDKYPDWANYDNRGNMIPVGQTKPFFDPANPEVRQYLLKLYEEIVTRYNVDGLQLDYIRYPFQDPAAGKIYGYGRAARQQFQQLTGVDPINISPSDRDMWLRWTEFRTQQVDSFVAEVAQYLRQKRSHVILSVAVFPLPEIERIQKIQQHWEVWARRGDIDLIVPMTYALDTPRFQRLAQPWIASKQLGATLLVPGIRLLSLPIIGAFDQLQLVRDLPVSGYALFAAENFNNELHQVFSNTQGKLPKTVNEPIPHRQPFQTAAVRYAALQREWQMVLQNDQTQMPASTIADLNSQAEALQKTLNQLANTPSATQLLSAKASLTRFQTQFRSWMRQGNLDNDYQIRVWENRLVTIERLLRYGERRVLRP